MTKRQIFQLLFKIASAYPIKNTEITQEKIDTYYEALIDCDLYCVVEMLKRHIASGNKYPPTLGDLIPTKRKELPSEVYSLELQKWSNNVASMADIESIIYATKQKLEG
jgi:Loader and inhibitor of phage G40P